jgi:hypothetical protein
VTSTSTPNQASRGLDVLSRHFEAMPDLAATFSWIRPSDGTKFGEGSQSSPVDVAPNAVTAVGPDLVKAWPSEAKTEVLLLRLALVDTSAAAEGAAVLSTNEYWLPPPGHDPATEEAA